MTKVIIEDRRCDEIKVGELRTGEFFVSEGDLFIVTDEEEKEKRKVVCLDSGSSDWFGLNTYVEKLNSVTISFT